MKLLIVLGLLSIAGIGYSKGIAIIDSGLDVGHPELQDMLWINPDEVVNGEDDDQNSYVDDIHGWNFAENSPELVDYRHSVTYTNNVFRLFEIQSKILRGTASEAELAWVNAKMEDPLFIIKVAKFGRYVHGTHVAGIASAVSETNRVAGLQIISAGLPIKRLKNSVEQALRDGESREFIVEILIKFGIKFIANKQGEALVTIGQYINDKNFTVANGSFGFSQKHAKMLLRPILSLIFRESVEESVLTNFANYYVNQLVLAHGKMLEAAPNTLFVFAAGNDAVDNDIIPTTPANVRLDNAISVAATDGYGWLAAFSNYGVQNVDIAAPGVAINSQIPDGRRIELSGTSQAAPFVAGVAEKLLTINPNLSILDVKKILFKTVDIKGFLKSKVKSGGILNSERAVLAAELSLENTLDLAIDQSRTAVPDVIAEARDQPFVDIDRLINLLPSGY